MYSDYDTKHDHDPPAPSKKRAGAGGAIVFWVLLAVSACTLAPCILLPEWRELQLLRLAENAQQSRADRMQAQVDHQERLVRALRSDPTLVERMARRELGFQDDSERTVPVAVNDQLILSGSDLAREGMMRVSADQPLVPVAAEPLWPDYKYDLIFCDSRTRPMIIAMSVALAAAAFAVLGWRDPPEAESRALRDS